jgi:hypothetical protein
VNIEEVPVLKCLGKLETVIAIQKLYSPLSMPIQRSSLLLHDGRNER